MGSGFLITARRLRFFFLAISHLNLIETLGEMVGEDGARILLGVSDDGE